MKSQPQKLFVPVLLLSFVLAGCGQRGPLYHPVKPAELPTPEQNAKEKQKTNH